MEDWIQGISLGYLRRSHPRTHQGVLTPWTHFERQNKLFYFVALRSSTLVPREDNLRCNYIQNRDVWCTAKRLKRDRHRMTDLLENIKNMRAQTNSQSATEFLQVGWKWFGKLHRQGFCSRLA